MKKGFTLVELSIVLVIIGLLIGGILAAQSMIASASLNAQVVQVQQFDTMVMNFKEKFNYLPGDAPSFGGDGNMALTKPGGALHVNCYDGELKFFWNNIMPDKFTDTSLGAVVAKAKTNIPAAKMGNSGAFVLAHANALFTAADMTNIANYYTLLMPSGTTCFKATTNTTSALKPAEALSIDTKIDDQLPNSGNVRAGSVPDGGGGVGSPTTTGLVTCNDSTSYLIANDTYTCTPMFRMGGTSGSVQ